MNELTYILGAGASFQSMPVVKSFSNRFKTFLDWIDGSLIKGQGFSPDEKQKFGMLYESGKGLQESFESHQSFDTYFKKLFHTGQHEKTNQGKKIINLYFTWEHLSKPSPKPIEHNDAFFWKQSIVDKRYDALIAGLLKPLADNKEPYCKVNFITWNYDLNLFMSLKNYFSPNSTIGDFFKQINKEHSWEIEGKITVVNMNGFFYNSYFSDLINLSRSTIYDIIYNKIKQQDYFSKYELYANKEHANDIDDDAELLKFAWETKNFNAKVAESMIRESKNIIVIGYTFPLYNRSVDLKYFNGELLYGRRLVVQDPNVEEMKNDVIENFYLKPLQMRGQGILCKANCDSFFIPNDIFN